MSPRDLPADRLASLQSKLAQLNDAITQLSLQIEYAPVDILPPWQDLMTKYSLLVSHTHSLSDLLIPPPSRPEDGQYRSRDKIKQDADNWQKTLNKVLVHPNLGIEADKEFIVGILLRTKQIPEIEDALNDLRSEYLKDVDNPEEVEAFKSALAAHDELAERAAANISRMKEGIDDREYDWKARLLPEEPAVEINRDAQKQKVQELAFLMKNGRMP